MRSDVAPVVRMLAVYLAVAGSRPKIHGVFQPGVRWFEKRPQQLSISD